MIYVVYIHSILFSKYILCLMLFTLCLLHSHQILFLVLVSSSSVKCLSTSIVGLDIGSKSFVCKLFFQWFLHSKLNIYCIHIVVCVYVLTIPNDLMLSTIETTKYVYQGSSPFDITIDNCKCCCLAVLIRLVIFTCASEVWTSQHHGKCKQWHLQRM